MVDSPREIVGAVLKSMGASYNTHNISQVPGGKDALLEKLVLLTKQVMYKNLYRSYFSFIKILRKLIDEIEYWLKARHRPGLRIYSFMYYGECINSQFKLVVSFLFIIFR